MQKTWKIGFKEIASRASGLPDGYDPDTSWRFPTSNTALFANPNTRRELIDMYRLVGGSLPSLPDFSRPEIGRMILARLNQALSTGEIVALTRRAPSAKAAEGGGGSGSPSASNPSSAAAAPPPSSETSPEKTWIDIQLVDEDGEPIPGERYILKITDGSTREGNLDDSGRVRVNGIDPGTCTVVFPDLDTTEWKRKS